MSAPSGYKKVGRFNPDQMNLFKSLFSQLGPDSRLGRLATGDEEIFGEIETPALRQFSGLQGQLGSRFSGMGGLGGRRSSGFQNASNQAASEFASQLQSQRQKLQSDALRDLFGFSESLMGQREYDYMPKGGGFLESLLGQSGDIIEGIAKIIPFFL